MNEMERLFDAPNLTRDARVDENDFARRSVSGRRRILRFGLAMGLGGAIPRTVMSHGVGVVTPPLSLPLDCIVTSAEGRHVPLTSLLLGNITAVQFMFTGCSQICPLQGAVFSAVQEQLLRSPISNVRLLSLSIDSHDTAGTLASWLRMFQAKQGWSAAVPSAHDIETIQRVLQPLASGPSRHSSQVYFSDRTGRVVWRSEELPPVKVILKTLRQLA